jgi:hypothetical protein
MIDFFDERTHQVQPSEFSSFGINITSRYGQAWELVELLNFTQELAEKKLHSFIDGIFYDSKADICTFSVSKTLPKGISDAILKCALLHISQFEWEGIVHHGEPMYAQIDGLCEEVTDDADL